MTDEASKPAGIKGMWDLSDLTDGPVDKPSSEQADAAHRAGERLGFVSREKPCAEPVVQRERSEFTARMSIRVRPSDKQRFEDLGWRLRRPLGEILGRALELYIAEQEKDEVGGQG